MNFYLTFSDGAKFADIARNIINGFGFVSGFNYFNPGVFICDGLCEAINVPPVMPLAIAVFFKLFGVSDKSVIATSFFFFILTIVFTYLLGKKLFGKAVGVFSALVIFINQNFIDYATNGNSETLFMFEIVAIPYLMLLKKRWATISSFLLMVVCYFTRPQAFIFIAGYMLFYLLLNYKLKRAMFSFLGVVMLGFVIDRFILIPLSGKYFIYSVTQRGIHAVTQITQHISFTDILRGLDSQTFSPLLTIKKTFLNLFNFYRSLPNIVNPYLFVFFILSLLGVFKKREEKAFISMTLFTTFLSFLFPAMTIPLYRYIHPVLPLVYIVGVASLVTIVNKILNFNFLIFKKFSISKSFVVVGISGLLIIFFVFIMQVGIFLHDYKYFKVRRNYGNPPVYVKLSKILQENTNPNDLVITNLDTWGTWYGERKTIWFPLKPSQLNIKGSSVIDAIYLTSFLMNDENYYMGSEWKQIFENPENIENEFIRENFEFAGEFKVPASEVYEKYDSRAILLVRKQKKV